MNNDAIDIYDKELEDLSSGGDKETTVRGAFGNLLRTYANRKNYKLIDERGEITRNGNRISYDGYIRDSYGFFVGCWEAKDSKDKLYKEIEEKRQKSYNMDNIIFENTINSILIQDEEIVLEGKCKDKEALGRALDKFFEYKTTEQKDFLEASNNFIEVFPKVLSKLKNVIENKQSDTTYKKEREAFLAICKKAIHNGISYENVEDMALQHILTEDIFGIIFDDKEFHKDNILAKAINTFVDSFYDRDTRKEVKLKLDMYYKKVHSASLSFSNYIEKQTFLKKVYQDFYKLYNPQEAQSLGTIYTPHEIVRFMIHITDNLLMKHFQKRISNPGVSLLDPCTGTGTFLVDIMEYLSEDALKMKYNTEISGSEVSILPYYIAHLNIEYTYYNKTKQYKTYKGLCFADTLEQLQGHRVIEKENNQGILLEDTNPLKHNQERIDEQNNKPITVIIGNPPYYANQKNENNNNKNKVYSIVDKRIKETFKKLSTATKGKLEDLYVRFIRWALDRLEDDGIICFITNRSFIDGSGFDGFRASVNKECAYVYVIDLGGDIRKGGTANVFDILTGVAILVLVKKKERDYDNAEIFYTKIEGDTKYDKLTKLSDSQNKAGTNNDTMLHFRGITPNKIHQWIDKSEGGYETLIPLYNGKNKSNNVFIMACNGISTNRDSWCYDASAHTLEKKVHTFIERYNAHLDTYTSQTTEYKNTIKWSRDLKSRYYTKNKHIQPDYDIIKVMYRPFTEVYYTTQNEMSDVLTEHHRKIVGKDYDKENIVIAFSDIHHTPIATQSLLGLDTLGHTKLYSRYTYDADNNKISNIEDAFYKKVVNHYNDTTITQDDIFYYIYGILHNHTFLKKYKNALSKEDTRIPLEDDFWHYSKYGKELMDIHINYKNAVKHPVRRVDVELKKGAINVAKNKINKECNIAIDNITTLYDIPSDAYKYMIGGKNILQWALKKDYTFYKQGKDETVPRDLYSYNPLSTEEKEATIEHIQRLITVSLEAQKIIKLINTQITQS